MKQDNKILLIVGIVVVGIILYSNYNQVSNNLKYTVFYSNDNKNYHIDTFDIPELFAVGIGIGGAGYNYQTTKSCVKFMTSIGNPSMNTPFNWAYTRTKYKCIQSFTSVKRGGCQLKYSIGKCPCISNWNCTMWSTCINNNQTRTCTDSNNCGTTSGKPTTSQSCTPLKVKPYIDSTCTEFKERFKDIMNTDQNGHYGFIRTGKTWGLVGNDWGYGWAPDFNKTGCLDITGLENKNLTFEGFDKYIFYKDKFAIICNNRVLSHPYDNYGGDPVQACFKEFNDFYNQFKTYVSQSDPVYWDYLSKNKLLLFNYAGENAVGCNGGMSCYIWSQYIDKNRGDYPTFTCSSIGPNNEPVYGISELGNLRCMMHESGHWIEPCNHNQYLTIDKSICSTSDCKIEWGQWW